MKIIHWFRQDLRLSDNSSLSAAAKQGVVLPLYILDQVHCSKKPLGAASRCWLHHSLQDLNAQLKNKLIVQCGDPLVLIPKLIKKYGIEAVYWNRCYEPWQIKRDEALQSKLEKLGITVITHNGSLLWEPWEIQKKDGENYKIFTPYYQKGCLQATPPHTPIRAPKIKYFTDKLLKSSVDSLHLLPDITWDEAMMENWEVGESAAKKKLKQFIQKGLKNYDSGRDIPGENNISRLSPYLHWGEISPNQVWHAIKKQPQNKNTKSFLSELAWREFCYSLLYYYPSLPQKNLQEKFNAFPWRKNKKLLTAWQQGQTGYPIVDAGMRELWQTGFMHNRVRMIVASFLIKNLMIHWHEGERWFWDCLVDADLANNSANWQWVAGCGADAAPFFRIFNPILQGKKFDSKGEYTKKYVPELDKLPNKYLFAPWEAPEDILQKAGIKLGKTYPKPIVDLSISRERALKSYKALKK